MYQESFRQGDAAHPAYLDDYAFMIAAFLDLYEATHVVDWFQRALALDQILAEEYEDQELQDEIEALVPMTGTILAVSRAIGETAPLVVVGASTFITLDPTSPFSKFTTLPIQIYQWTARPQDEFRNIAAAAILVLLVLLLTLNATAVFLRNRFSKRRLG